MQLVYYQGTQYFCEDLSQFPNAFYSHRISILTRLPDIISKSNL